MKIENVRPIRFLRICRSADIHNSENATTTSATQLQQQQQPEQETVPRRQQFAKNAPSSLQAAFNYHLQWHLLLQRLPQRLRHTTFTEYFHSIVAVVSVCVCAYWRETTTTTTEKRSRRRKVRTGELQVVCFPSSIHFLSLIQSLSLSLTLTSGPHLHPF